MEAAPVIDGTEIWATKLQSAGDWSGPSLASQITRERLQGLLRVFQRGKLDNMVKVRILIVCLFLPRAELMDFKPELMQLAEQARHDEDEWVRVMGEAVGTFDGQLDLRNVCESSSLVRDTMVGLQASLHLARPLPGFMPLQEPLMHPDMRVWRSSTSSSSSRTAHSHFAGQREDSVRAAEEAGASGRHPLDALLPGIEVWSMDMRGGSAPRAATSSAHTSIHARRGTQAESATMFRPSAPPLAPSLTSKPAPLPAHAATPYSAHPLPLLQPPQQQEEHGQVDEGGPGSVGGVAGALPRGMSSSEAGRGAAAGRGGVSTGTALLAAHRQVRTQPLQLQEARAASQAAVQAQAQVQAGPSKARGRPRKQQQGQPGAGPSAADEPSRGLEAKPAARQDEQHVDGCGEEEQQECGEEEQQGCGEEEQQGYEGEEQQAEVDDSQAEGQQEPAGQEEQQEDSQQDDLVEQDEGDEEDEEGAPAAKRARIQGIGSEGSDIEEI